MEKMQILSVSRTEYAESDYVAACNHCANCGGSTGCGAHFRGGAAEDAE